MNVRLLTGVGPYKSLGCFRDDAGNRAIPFLEGLDPILDGSHSVRQDPISKCYEAATTRGYEVFAVQDGGLCAASAVAELTYGKHGPSDACGPEGEGGLMANHVYQTEGNVHKAVTPYVTTAYHFTSYAAAAKQLDISHRIYCQSGFCGLHSDPVFSLQPVLDQGTLDPVSRSGTG